MVVCASFLIVRDDFFAVLNFFVNFRAYFAVLKFFVNFRAYFVGLHLFCWFLVHNSMVCTFFVGFWCIV